MYSKIVTVVTVEPGYYLGNKMSGEEIDNSIYRIIFAMALGMLIKIRNSVEK